MSRHRAGPLSFALLVSLVALLASLLPAAASSAPPGCANRTNNTYAKLLDCVTVEGVRAHQAALQRIADANDDPFFPGSRAAGTEGYQGSVDYVAGLLGRAGYDVTLDEFEFEFTFAEVQQLTPIAATYTAIDALGASSGDVTGPVIPVDINLTGDRANTSACEPGDFDGLDFSGTNDIALIQRGTCFFDVKSLNAEAAGAEAVVIFNQGNTPERSGLFGADLGGEDVVDIPVVTVSFADGEALAAADSTARVTMIEPEIRTDVNVIAELPGDNTSNVVMAGAHLDSVGQGPGINDNGSGSAALLETALMIAKLKPENTLRFAWWGAEESGLIGSTAYVEGLSQAERDRIAMYMNYDMVGSPNYVTMVYDADESTFPAPAGPPPVPIPNGSIAIEDLYESYYTLRGEPYDDTEFSGRSDYQAFIEADIPSGGLFTGAEEIKTAEQQAIWGGEVEKQLDPCYHLACDTIGNFNSHVLNLNSDLIAFAMLTFAYSTESVNGIPGKDVPGPAFTLPPPAGPEGTFEAP